jgi:hypothetical protein
VKKWKSQVSFIVYHETKERDRDSFVMVAKLNPIVIEVLLYEVVVFWACSLVGGISNQHMISSSIRWVCGTHAVPATWEAKAGGSLEPRSLDTSLGNTVRPRLKKKKV